MIRSSPLEGLKIPKLHERLKALLFADDTTVFLSSKDSFDSLINILDSWCSAAGAKFNKNKTEIIPFGSQEYKTSVRETKKPHAESPPLPEHIKISKEGELTRILGAWFGNQESTQPWTTIIDRTTTKLHEWRKSSPTLEGTRLVNWMENMSSSQFLTKAQGMPIDVANKFERMTKEF
ncbi:hypothetical protein AGABI1DRAFT_15024, partial [Agaricus bisporus var. burnettii JB137-S8]